MIRDRAYLSAESPNVSQRPIIATATVLASDADGMSPNRDSSADADVVLPRPQRGTIWRRSDDTYLIILPVSCAEGEVRQLLLSTPMKTQDRYAHCSRATTSTRALYEALLPLPTDLKPQFELCTADGASSATGTSTRANLCSRRSDEEVALRVHASLVRQIPVLATLVQGQLSPVQSLADATEQQVTRGGSCPMVLRNKAPQVFSRGVQFEAPESIWALLSVLMLSYICRIAGMSGKPADMAVEAWLGKERCDPALPAQTLVVCYYCFSMYGATVEV